MDAANVTDKDWRTTINGKKSTSDPQIGGARRLISAAAVARFGCSDADKMLAAAAHTARPTPVHNPNGILIGSAVFAGLTIMTDRQTDRQTTLLSARSL